MDAVFEIEVIEGIQRIMALRLTGSPAGDTVEVTTNVWIDALSRQARNWNPAIDKGRITQAFVRLSTQIDRWPAPYQLIQLIPYRAPQKSLPPIKLSPAQMRANQARLKAILKQLTQKMEMPK